MKHIFDEDGICKECGLDGADAAWIRLVTQEDCPPIEQEECPIATIRQLIASAYDDNTPIFMGPAKTFNEFFGDRNAIDGDYEVLP